MMEFFKKSQPVLLIKKVLKNTKLLKYYKKYQLMTLNKEILGTKLAELVIIENYNPIKISKYEIIRSSYMEYTKTVSTNVAAMSLELALLIWFVMKKTNPKVLVDLGSGFSSYLFRLYQKERQNSGEMCKVISVDNNSEWLQLTINFLKSKDLSYSDVILWNDFVRNLDGFTPNLIFYDLGNSFIRVKNLPSVIEMMGKNTILIADDIHKPKVKEAVLKYKRDLKLNCYDLASITFDGFGRYAWLILNHDSDYICI